MKSTTEENIVQDKVAEIKGIPKQDDLVEQLKEGVLVVTFNKKDGDERVMTCTKSLDVIPKESHPSDGKTLKEGLLNVWDVTAQGWRSFYYNRVTIVTQGEINEPG